MRFGAPINFWLLALLPLLAVFCLWALARRQRGLEAFASADMAPRLTGNVSRARQYLRYVLVLAGLGLLMLALTAPQFGAKLAMAQHRGIDLVIALDLSRSMLAQDLKPNRLERAKYQIRQLLDLLEGDRVGLVVFAGRAFVQCPLTLDYGTVRLFLDIVDTETVPVQGTAIGQALRLSKGLFAEEDNQHKAILLFTDGEDHVTKPVGAAERAAAEGIRIFVVGLGTAEGELIPAAAEGATGFHKDNKGNYVKTRLDQKTLVEIAAISEGAYFQSSLQGEELAALAAEITAMNQKDLGSRRHTQYKERYQIPLLMALVCFGAATWISERRRQKQEWRGRFL